MSLNLSHRTGFNIRPRPDPYWSQVAFLLLMDGTDEVASTTDSSSNAHTINFNNSAGNAVIDTAQYVGGGNFPNASFRCDATIDSSIGYMYWADSSAFALGADPFTFEGFARHNGASWGTTTRYIAGQIDDNAGVLVSTNSSIYVAVANGILYANGYRSSTGGAIHSGGAALGGVTTMSGNAWYYYCYCRDGDTFRIYLGQPGGTATQENSAAAITSGVQIADSSANWGVGICGEWPSLSWYNLNGTPNISGMSGWMGPQRLTKGVCRYPGGTSYAVPTTFPVGP